MSCIAVQYEQYKASSPISPVAQLVLVQIGTTLYDVHSVGCQL